MIISHSRKLIFIHIPKCGGSTVERALEPFLDWNDVALGTSDIGNAMNRPFRERFGLFDHGSLSDVIAICGASYIEEYFTFALVRHPVERAMSSFNYIAQMCRYPCNFLKIDLDTLAEKISQDSADPRGRKDLIRRYPFLDWDILHSFLRTQDFSAFIRDPVTLADPAFVPQVDFVSSLDGKTRLDHIVKLEELHRFATRLSKHLGTPITFGHHNRSEKKRITRDTLSRDDRTYLRHYFDQDFLAFEYD